MFSPKQKQEIAEKVQQILRDTEHPELSDGEINFTLFVEGAENWSWADIKNNGAFIVDTLSEANPNEPSEARFRHHHITEQFPGPKKPIDK